MSRVVKDLVVSDMRKRLGSTRDLVIVDTSKLDAFSQNTLRLKLREKNIRVMGVKNTFAKKVLGELGVSGLDESLKGASSLVWGATDIVALTKELTKQAKDNKALVIKGGVVEGTGVNPQQVDDISKGPTREELIGQLVGMILGPGAQLAAALLGPGGALAGQIKSLSEEKPAEGGAEAPAA